MRVIFLLLRTLKNKIRFFKHIAITSYKYKIGDEII
jgi:hypothetical protein